MQIPPKENRFQYVRRVYATAINFPFIITLVWVKCPNYKEVPHYQAGRNIIHQIFNFTSALYLHEIIPVACIFEIF